MGALSTNNVSVKGRVRADLQAKYQCDEIFAPEEKTTLMLRGIPRYCTEEDLIHHIEDVAGGPYFDFVYLPWDKKRSANMGFAFVNCVRPHVALELLSKIQCQTTSVARDAPRPIHALFAYVQGLMLNVAHYIGSSVVAEGAAHVPIIFHGGRRISFQEAVDRFVPPELAEAQLREAEWAKSQTAAPNGPHGKCLGGPTSGLGMRLKATGSSQKSQFVAPPFSWPAASASEASASRPLDLGTQLASMGASRKPQFVAPPFSWSASSGSEASASRPLGQGSTKAEVLQSKSYATAWAHLNAQLEALGALSGTAHVAAPGTTAGAYPFSTSAGAPCF